LAFLLKLEVHVQEAINNSKLPTSGRIIIELFNRLLLALDFVIQTLQERAKQILSATCMFDEMRFTDSKKSSGWLNHIRAQI
jgi:hypothetical protein